MNGRTFLVGMIGFGVIAIIYCGQVAMNFLTVHSGKQFVFNTGFCLINAVYGQYANIQPSSSCHHVLMLSVSYDVRRIYEYHIGVGVLRKHPVAFFRSHVQRRGGELTNAMNYCTSNACIGWNSSRVSDQNI